MMTKTTHSKIRRFVKSAQEIEEGKTEDKIIKLRLRLLDIMFKHNSEIAIFDTIADVDKAIKEIFAWEREGDTKIGEGK
jgi:hypothetical protein